MSVYGCELMYDPVRTHDMPNYKDRCKVELFMRAVHDSAIVDGCTIEYHEVDMSPRGVALRLRITMTINVPITTGFMLPTS